MIRRISALALGFAVSLLALNAFAQDDSGGGDEGGGDKGGEAKGGGEAKAGGEASASAAVTSMPESKGAFGKSGQIAISSDLELTFESRKSKPPSGPEPDATTTIAILPALDYFVADNISVGAQVGIQMVKQGDAKAQQIIVGPRVGYNLGLTDNLSFWPKVGFAYKAVSVNPGTPGSSSQSGSKMTVMVHAPILFHPAEHFFVGLGPTFEMDLSSKIEGNDYNKDTAFGLGSVVGGWF